MNQIWCESLVQAAEPLVPNRLFYAVEGTLVMAILILQASADDLVWVSRHCGEELGQSGEEKVFSSTLQVGMIGL